MRAGLNPVRDTAGTQHELFKFAQQFVTAGDICSLDWRTSHVSSREAIRTEGCEETERIRDRDPADALARPD